MGIKEKMDEHRRIMLDSAPVIYFIEEHPRYGPISNEIFKKLSEIPQHFMLFLLFEAEIGQKEKILPSPHIGIQFPPIERESYFYENE